MRSIIRDGEIVQDDCTHLGDDEPLPTTGPITVSLSRFLRDEVALRDRQGLGVRLAAADDPAQIAEALPLLTRVVLEIKTFRDGRHFSTARLLRSRYGFKGEIRAIGDVLPDQMHYMHRCGMSAFEVKSGKRLDTALRCLRAFSTAYQAAEDQPLPLYRRRAGG